VRQITAEICALRFIQSGANVLSLLRGGDTCRRFRGVDSLIRRILHLMKRSRITTTLGLKHLAFFEAVGEAKENSPNAHSATAGLLLLRLIDHWVLAGAVMVEPESVSVKSVRNALMKLEPSDPSREVLLGLINAMQTVREVDIQPVLPRLFAYAGCLEKRAQLPLAADVYGTIARLAEEDFDGDLLIDSFLRLGYCQRVMGTLADAESSYVTAGKIAKRQKETARGLRSQIGIAIVVMTRGNLPKAEELLSQVAAESERVECIDELARTLHVQASVAYHRGSLGSAVGLAYKALCRTVAPGERDMILADLGAYLIVMNRFEAAHDALLILEATTASELLRVNARVNMVALAARSGDEILFRNTRARLEGTELPVDSEVNYLIESARGLRRFGEADVAQELLERARDLATTHKLNRSIFEAEEMLSAREVVVKHEISGVQDLDSAVVVEQELRRMALAVA
jgi:tetratricopeptide (TPR) repeat protein